MPGEFVPTAWDESFHTVWLLPALGRRPMPCFRAEVSGEPTLVAACHCEQCQRRTGSAFAGEAAALSGVLPVRAQRTPSRQSPAWRAHRRLGRMRQIQHPESQQEPRQKLAGLYLSPASISFLRRRNLLDGRRPNTFKELCRGRRVKGAAPDNRERTHVDTLV